MTGTLAFLGNLAGPDILIVGCATYALAIIAIIDILKSRADSLTKLLWFLIVWFIPLIGSILFFTIGKKQFPLA